jgi:hypothetical protein
MLVLAASDRLAFPQIFSRLTAGDLVCDVKVCPIAAGLLLVNVSTNGYMDVTEGPGRCCRRRTLLQSHLGPFVSIASQTHT